MDADRHQRIKAVFSRASELPPDERSAYLDDACGDDDDLRREVESLLEHADHPAVDIEGAAAALGEAIGPPDRPPRLERLGGYRILEILGEGGMGVVYLAEQDSPRRTVALKVLRPGLASASVLRRFEYEAEILGRLQHPGIAQIHEAATAEIDIGDRRVRQPYFAMEYVKGRPLLQHADEHDLDTAARLDLLVRICEAIEHAHQHGVIHRDLKPANILIDERGRPKVLDFGIARATDSDLQLTTVRTDIGQLLGTVPYMSPEQAAGDPSDLDTRSDIYAIGVIAYELLAGRLPYDLREKMIHEALRVIREDDPTPLSSIDRIFRGDLETIVGTALAKDKTRRYQTASALAADLVRYMGNEPIAARAPSAMYQIGKFARRNRPLVAGAIAVLIALVLGVIGTSWGWHEATAQRNVARQASDAEANQRRRAEREARIAEAVNAFLTDDLLARADPEVEPDRDLMLRDVLDRASGLIEGRFADAPEVEAAVRYTISQAYFGLGVYPASESHMRRVLEIRRAAAAGDHLETASALNYLANISRIRGRYDEALALYTDAMEMFERLEGRSSLGFLENFEGLAVVALQQGHFDEAFDGLTESLALKRQAFGDDDHFDLANTLNNLAVIQDRRGEYAESERLHRETLRIWRLHLAPDHQSIAMSLNGLAAALDRQGREAESLPLYEEAIEITRARLGDDHPNIGALTYNLGYLHLDLGNFDAAEPLLLDAFERLRSMFGDDHPDTITVRFGYLAFLERADRLDEAELLAAELRDRSTAVNGREHGTTADVHEVLATIARKRGDLPAATASMRTVLEIRRAVLRPDHPWTLRAMKSLADDLWEQGNLDASEPLYREYLDGCRRRYGDDSAAALSALNGLAGFLRQADRFDEAQPLYETLLATRRATLATDHADVGAACLFSGLNLIGLERYDDAEPLLRECLELRTRTLPPDDWRLDNARAHLGRCLVELSRFDDAEPLLLTAHEGTMGRATSTNEQRAASFTRLITLYERWGKDGEAERWKREQLKAES